jgi:hypothetical protein
MQKIDVACDTLDKLQMVDANCDTKDLITNAQDTKDMESSIQMMEEVFVKDESQEEAHNDNNNNNNKCEEAKKQQNDFSKMSDLGKNYHSTKIDMA